MDQEEIIFLGCAGLIILLLILYAGSFGPLALVMLIIGILFVIVLLVMDFADYLVFPLITNIFKLTIVPAKNYTISHGQQAIIKNVNGLFYATGYLTGNLYSYVFKAERADEKAESEMTGAMDKWEKIVMNVDFPFKFNIISMAQDIQKYRDELEGQRGFYEFQMSRMLQSTQQNPVDMQEIQKRINMIELKMNKIGEGEKPLNSIVYIESTAVGISEKEALDILDQQMNQLQTVFNSFDLSIMRIVGRELYFLYRFNYRLLDTGSTIGLFSGQK